jgi:N-acetylglucosamine-6-phosphate deacetylase
MTSFTAKRVDTGDAVRVTIRDDRIESVLPFDCDLSNTSELPFVGPGLFDLQVNGAKGIWFSSETLTVDEVERVVEVYLQQGITRCLPTLITNSFGAIEHGLQTIRAARDRNDLVRRVVVGCHIEGPYISAVDGPRGAHPIAHVRPPDITEFTRWQRAAGGIVRLITLAPESPGASEFIRFAVRAGVAIAIGHTAASPAQIVEAIDSGATLGTHLGNGCAGMIPRHDNVLWTQLADDRLTVSVIADGWHLPAAILKCIVRCKSLRRIVLTSDISGFGGCPPGRYSTPAVDVDILDDGRIVVAGQNIYLAGSGATTGDCVAHFVSTCDVSLADAWTLASNQPAELLGYSQFALEPGQPACLTVFNLERDSSDAGDRPRFRFRPQFTMVDGITTHAVPD